MQLRQLGKTGLQVSALGFGCMRLPKLEDDPKNIDEDASHALFRRAVDLGVNYFDTAYIYNNGDSERVLGKFLKTIDRERVVVTTKNWVGHQFKPLDGQMGLGAQWRQALEEELERLDTPYIDCMLFHDMQLPVFRIVIKGPNGPFDEALRAKEEGLIRHIGFSCHDTPKNMTNIIDLGGDAIEMIVCQYNLLDRVNEPVLDYCRERNVGVAIMGPVGGGRLMHPSEAYSGVGGAASTPELALRFVLSNPGVSTAMSGMNTMEQLEENAAAASLETPLSDDDLKAIDGLQAQNKELLDLYCTGCAYCMPCHHGLDIPGNFAAMNMLKVHGMADLAKASYSRLGDKKAEMCESCQDCVGKCPQHIDIPGKLKEVADAFTGC